MTYKNTKTILFASLIVAMVLPFSGMQSANADHYGNGVNHDDVPVPTTYNYEERQENLINMLADVELRIDTARNDALKENFELVKQRILAKLLQASVYENGALELGGPYALDFEITGINFSIEGDNLGCDGVIESWSFEGVLTNGQTLVLISQDFPDELISGVPPNCAISVWANNVHLAMQPAILGEGCQGDLNIVSTADYLLDCQVDMNNGLWIVGITFDYGSYTETKYTYVDV